MFDILCLENEFIIIDKYPGVSVHKDDGDTMLLQEVAQITGDKQLYLVHRLDKMTSGILLLARNKSAASELSTAFAQRNVEKYYLAIGSKKPKKKQGLIRGDMERTRRSGWKLMPSQFNPAMTQFQSLIGETGERVFICKPYTGKTHQIRVALKSIGSAIVGDPIYNASSKADRGYLHAYAIRFEYQHQVYQYICTPSVGCKWNALEMKEALFQWRLPWDMFWPKIK